MFRKRMAYTFSACVLIAASAGADTNTPCVDVTSEEPYGFPLTVECPFEFDRKLLDQAVQAAKSAAPLDIKKARVGHMSHPFWSPGVVFFYEPFRTNGQSVSTFLHVYLNDRVEEKVVGGAGCGRDLVKITSATLRPSRSERTNEVFSVGERDVVAHVRCVNKEEEEREGSIYINSERLPLEKEYRAEIQSLLECIDTDRFLDGGHNHDIKTILGRVYPGEGEKEIIPKEIAGKAFADVKSEEEILVDGELVLVDVISYQGDMLTRGSWTRPLQGSYIEYIVNAGVINVRCSTRKHGAEQSSFSRIDGVWVKTGEYSVCF